MAIRIYLRVGAPIDLPTGAEVEGTKFPAGAGCDGRAAIEIVDREGNVDPPEAPERP